jgi:Icc-related predicted phosphoesterase
MKLLLFSDIHCDVSRCELLVERSKDVDIVIGAGDFANFRRGLDLSIEVLKKMIKQTILVPGNSESFEELVDACKDWKESRVLHGSGLRIYDYDFYGVGGGIPITPFGDWSYDFSEEEAKKLLSECPSGAILVTHSPPKGVLDKSSLGKSLGSKSIRETILEKNPLLVVCGHIHESSGKNSKLGNSEVVNAGPNGIIWEV